MNFVICAPPYKNASAGTRVLYRLSEKLITLGHNSLVLTNLAVKKQFKPYVNDCVVVYPEITAGNPLEATHVVRYILYKPGFFVGGDLTFPDSELVFAYSKALIPVAQTATSQLLDASRVMEISVIEPWLFKPNPNTKKVYEIAFWLGKGGRFASKNFEVIKGFLKKKKFVLITKESPGTREELALLLQQSEEFITTDNCTALTAEAALCGCKVTLWDEEGMRDITEEASHWQNNWDDTSAIENFVEVCSERFSLSEAPPVTSPAA